MYKLLEDYPPNLCLVTVPLIACFPVRRRQEKCRALAGIGLEEAIG